MSESGAATGGAASGPAGGELAGNYPNPTLSGPAVLSRLESQFTAAVQLVMGTAAGAGALVVLANGYGITGFAANPPTPAVALTTVSTLITANVSLPANTATQVASVSLGAGSWVGSASARAHNGATAVANCDAWIGPTTASLAGALATGTATLGTTTSLDTDRTMPTPPVPLVLGATTTEFLNAESTQTATIASGGLLVTTNTATGMTWVRTS